MKFDAFEEGISLGGIRSKSEIRTLICYMFTTVDKPMTKEIVINSLLQKGLTNYFEATTAFDDLVNAENLKKISEDSELYTYTENTILISKQLEDTLSNSSKDKACECALSLLEQTRIEKENTVDIEKCDNGYEVTFTISGGEMDLMKLTLYVPQIEQARRIRKNFYNNPELFYEITIAMLTKNKKGIEDILESFKSVI